MPTPREEGPGHTMMITMMTGGHREVISMSAIIIIYMYVMVVLFQMIFMMISGKQ